MIAALLLATLTAAPGRPPAAGVEPAHAAAEAALLRTAYPDQDQKTGFLGHKNGYLIGRSSACAEDGQCYLAVTAGDGPFDRATGRSHAWSTFFAFRAAEAGWVEIGSAAGPVINTPGRWTLGVSVLVDGDGPFIAVSTSTTGDPAGEGAATHLWSWDGKRFAPVFTAATTRKGTAESEGSFVLCADRPASRPSWELRSREREGKGPWTERRARVAWNGQAWVERPAERACAERGSPGAATVASGPAALKVKSASASRTAPAPKGQPQATAASSAVDGDPQTAWVPGGKKGGAGEWLQLDLAEPAALGSVKLLGACPGAEGKTAPRLKKVRLRFEDGPAQEETLADAQAPQAIKVRRQAKARWIRIELVELYAGTKKPDACVAEITLLGR